MSLPRWTGGEQVESQVTRQRTLKTGPKGGLPERPRFDVTTEKLNFETNQELTIISTDWLSSKTFRAV